MMSIKATLKVAHDRFMTPIMVIDDMQGNQRLKERDNHNHSTSQ
jgi:hypothetical protein